MKKLLGIALILAVTGGIGLFSALAKDDKKEPSLMRKKLAHAQKILEALALNKFTNIEANAEELITISKHASWKANKSPKYELYSEEFRRIAETLIEKAREKNIDGATLAYLDLTMSCVKCHKHIRDTR